MVRWALVGLDSPGQRPRQATVIRRDPILGALGFGLGLGLGLGLEESSNVCLHALFGHQHLASLPIRTRSRELR